MDPLDVGDNGRKRAEAVHTKHKTLVRQKCAFNISGWNDKK